MPKKSNKLIKHEKRNNKTEYQEFRDWLSDLDSEQLDEVKDLISSLPHTL